MNTKKPLLDFIILIVVTFLFTAMMVSIDFFDKFYAFSRSHEDWELDEILLSVPFLTLCLLIYSFRRVREVQKEEKRREDAEKKAIIAASIKENEQRFRNLMDDVSMVAVQGYDEDLRIIFWNKACEKLFGFTMQETMSRPLANFLLPEDIRPQELERLSLCLRDSIPPLEHEQQLQHKNGSPVPVRSSYIIRTGVTGAKELYRIDISLAEIKKNHLQMVMAKEAAEKANKAKSEFLANMSHEIRTPLNGLLGMLQLLEHNVTENEAREYVHLAMDASRRLSRLLSDILDLSKVEAGKMSIQNFPFDLLESLEHVIELFRPLAQQTAMDLQLYLHPNLPRFVVGDANRLQQVCNNLLGNAFKFTSSGSIRLEAYPLPADKPGQQKLLFTVSDTGIGISEEEIKRLFLPFSQVDAGFIKKDRGVGLGLHISQRLVELMGGSIDVDSEPGEGSTFYFCITVGQTSDIAHDEAAHLTPQRQALQSATVLLAEDDEISALVVIKQLQSLGCAVRHVVNGKEALEALGSENFDLVLMDVQMPVMDGVSATSAIRAGDAGEQNANIPILALTAYAMLGDKQKMIDAGMNGYLSKPLELKELEKALLNLLQTD